MLVISEGIKDRSSTTTIQERPSKSFSATETNTFLSRTEMRLDLLNALPEAILASKDKLPLPEFESWKMAIENNDEAFVEQVLARCRDQEEVSAFIWAKFTDVYAPSSECKRKSGLTDCSDFNIPIVIAACFSSNKVLSWLLKYNTCAMSKGQDTGANNIIHCIIHAAYHTLEAGLAKDFVKIYKQIVSTLSLNEKFTLLMQENEAGYRPLELASRLHVFTILDLIINEDGVYRFLRTSRGIKSDYWYDVTDYEASSKETRKDKSPLGMLVHLEKKHATSKAIKVIESPVLKKWSSAVVTRNIPCLSMWFMLRFAYFIFFYLSDVAHIAPISQSLPPVDEQTRNLSCAISSDGLNQMGIYYFLLSSSSLMFLFDLVELAVHTFKSLCTCRDKKACYPNLDFGLTKGYLVHNTFYRINHFFLVSSFLIRALMLYCGSTSNYILVYILANFSNVWSLLYFIEFLPQLGPYVTGMQRMVSVMINFAVLFTFLYITFTYMFYVIVLFNRLCTSEFGTVDRSLYTGFLIMLNIVEVHEFFNKYPTLDRNPFSFLHILYIFLVGILVLNFLIALQASATDRIAGIKKTTQSLQRLSAALLVQRRLGWASKWLYNLLNRQLLVQANGRVYLLCEVTLPSHSGWDCCDGAPGDISDSASTGSAEAGPRTVVISRM